MTEPVEVRVLRAGDAPLPAYQTEGAAGCDLVAHLPDPVELAPGAFRMIPTGLRWAVPAGHEIQIRSRSGLAARHGVFCLNAPGTVDSDYRGEVRVILANAGPEPFVVEPGMRIAQAVLARVDRIAWREVPDEDALGETDRGEGGFGSTGR